MEKCETGAHRTLKPAAPQPGAPFRGEGKTAERHASGPVDAKQSPALRTATGTLRDMFAQPARVEVDVIAPFLVVTL